MAASDIQPTGFVDNWQAGKTLAECNLRMFDLEDSCDVAFRVGSTGDVIKAHSYVLISRSCVFHAMFTGDLAEKSDVSVPEMEPHDFKQFLIYLYTDNTTIDADNVTALSSRKYDITALESQCTKFLEEHLSADNACVILDSAYRFDERQLFQRAMTFIHKTAEQSLQSAGFLALSQVLVDRIVESDDMIVEEHVIFNVVNSWAEAECERQGREVTPETKRTILGETFLKIRFPLLNHAFMSKDVKSSGLLTEPERLQILEYKGCHDNDVKPFNPKQRKQKVLHTHSITRFKTENRIGWRICGHKKDAISFRSSQNVMLCGYRLYGAERRHEPTTYSVTTHFGDEEDVHLSLIQDRRQYTANSNKFDVVFEEPVAMTAGVWYTLAVLIEGMRTLGGQNGIRGDILCPDGVKFTFTNSKYSENNTSVIRGQIPSHSTASTAICVYLQEVT